MRISLFRTAALALLFVTTSVACAPQPPWVQLRGEFFTVEVADDFEEMRLGLMFRESMADDHGMIFIYPDEGRRSFWMKNTRIPLDILFFDSDLTLVDWHADVPPCKTAQCPSYPSEVQAQYVLELNAGKAAELGVTKGDRLEIQLGAQ